MRDGIDVTPCNWISARTWSFWKLVKDQHFDFAYVRITRGDSHCGTLRSSLQVEFNPYLDYGRQGREAGLEMGLIHTFNPKVDGAKQASFFANTINVMRTSPLAPLTRRRLRDYFTQKPTIWLEETGDPDQVQRGLVAFLKQWALLNQDPPRLAMSAPYAATNGINGIPNISAYPLWVLDSTGDKHPVLPSAWPKADLWQKVRLAPVSGQMVGINQSTNRAIPMPIIKFPSLGITPKLLLGAAAIGFILYVNQQGRVTERAKNVYGMFGE